MTGPLALVVAGAGPAGLSAARESLLRGGTATVLEKDDVVGGISRTVVRDGLRFDVGGHRFFTRSAEIEAIWRETLGGEMLRVPRRSRILYRGRLFSYPLRPLEALLRLGPVESVRCVASYARARLAPRRPEDDFETWVSNRFGRRLFEIFFRTYTEKVWGIPISEIRADWAAQRIRGLSLGSAAWRSLRPDPAVRTLVDAFDYPRLGPGQMWEAIAGRIVSAGSRVLTGRPVRRVEWAPGKGVTAFVAAGPSGEERHEGNAFVSSIPLAEFVSSLSPAPPDAVVEAARRLRFRDFLLVALVVEGTAYFPDNWVYVHSPELRVGRIQNFSNWSPDLVPRPGVTCVGMEYFCFESEPAWSAADGELVEMAGAELAATGLVPAGTKVLAGHVVRMPKAYPIYDPGYERRVETVRRWAESALPNLRLVGRNGMHRYNNQDHAMLTGIYAVRSLLGGPEDPWEVNTAEEYHEGPTGRGGR